jgi:hypothetical protein
MGVYKREKYDYMTFLFIIFFIFIIIYRYILCQSAFIKIMSQIDITKIKFVIYDERH